MMKSTYNSRPFLLIALLLTIAACERVITLDTEGHAPKIVMNGILSPDSLIEIRVSKSFLYTDTSSSRGLMDRATLTLFIDGLEKETMRRVRVDTVSGRDRLFGYTALVSVYRSTIRPKVGQRVRVEATAEGHLPAWAETSVPVPPTIRGVDTVTFYTTKRIIHNDYYNSLPESGMFQNLRVKMDVSTGTSGIGQQFLLQARLMTEEIEEYPSLPDRYLFLYTDDDPVFEESYRNSLLEELISDGFLEGKKHYDSALFSNKLFRDNRYTLNFSVTDYYYLYTEYEAKGQNEWGYPIYVPIKTERFNPPIEVLFTAISPELYLYYRAGEYNPDSDEESFKLISEPELTYSNVHNGIGVVGAVSSAKVRIKTPPRPYEE